MTDKIFIYALTDETNTVRYVGKTNNIARRYYTHINSAKGRKTHKECWIYGMLTRNLKPNIIILEECNIENWSEREIHHIKNYDNLTNLSEGGMGCSGVKFNNETKERMSVKKIGELNPFYNKTHSEETKKNLSEKTKEYLKTHDNPFKNKKHMIKTIEELSKIGKKRWEDGTLHLPPVMIGEDNPSTKKRIFISPDGEKHVVLNTQEFCKNYGLSYNTIKKNINKGIIKLPTDKITLIRQRKKSLNTVGWEIIE